MELTKPAPPASSSRIGALIALFYEPTRTFTALESRKAAWLTLILLMLSTAALMQWYFSAVDFAWLADQIVSTIKNTDEREKAMAMIKPNILRVSSIVGAVVGFPIILTLLGVYFMLAGKVISKEFTFDSGFALSTWASVPTLLNLPLGAMQILLASNGQLSLSDLNPLSLNTLLFRYDLHHPMTSLLDSLSVTSIWSAVLLVIGFQVWAKVPRATAIKVVLVPYAFIYGIWLAFALSKAT